MLTSNQINNISIVIPVFNEKPSLERLLERCDAACVTVKLPYEIIMVDDGSSDGSAQLITEFALQSGSKVVGLLLNRNYGQHAAIIAGFSVAKGDLVITLDADLQNPPEEIPRLVSTAQQGYDVVGTVRQQRQDSRFRRGASLLINQLIQSVTGKIMGDYGCMLRAYRRSIVEAILGCQERSTFIPILANSFARNLTEIPVAHAEREVGVSKYGLWQLINLMFDLITCLTTTPLRLLSIVGSLIACCGFIGAIILLLLRLFLGAEWAGGGVFTLFALLFSFIGAQFVGMGLLGEYIGRIYQDVRARPRYFIHQIIRSAPVFTINEPIDDPQNANTLESVPLLKD